MKHHTSTVSVLQLDANETAVWSGGWDRLVCVSSHSYFTRLLGTDVY
jgi:hypothetical protein